MLNKRISIEISTTVSRRLYSLASRLKSRLTYQQVKKYNEFKEYNDIIEYLLDNTLQ